MRANEFLRKVWAYQGDGYFCISSKRGSKWKDNWIKTPITKSKINSVLDKYSIKKYDLYFCPLPFRQPHRKKDLVLGSRLLWADLDEANPKGASLVPQIAWRSSKNRYASLWILDEFHTSAEIEPVNQSLTYSVGADKAGWDLTQVLRLPGTYNHKYDPPQKVKTLWFTDNEYTIDQVPHFRSQLNPQEVLEKYKDRIPGKIIRNLVTKRVQVGSRSDMLWRLENELYDCGLSEQEIFTLVKHSAWNKFAGRKNEDQQLGRELEKIRDKKDRPKLKAPQENINGSVVNLSRIKPQSVKWLWYPYIPEGKLTIFEGDPGLGKSWLTLAIANHLSKGDPLPQHTKIKVGNIVLMSAEDGLADTIVPKLISFGANRRKFNAVTKLVTLDEDGLEFIDDIIGTYSPSLVIIDPLVAYISQIDMHKANETRKVMAEVASIAEKRSTSILAVRHLTKGSREKTIYRGQGSIDFLASARSVVQIGRDPLEDDIRIMCHVKCNLAPLGESQRYSLKDGKFHWAGVSDFSVDEILKTERGADHQMIAEATEFLKEILESEDRIRRIFQEAEKKSYDKNLIEKAARRLKLKKIMKKGIARWSGLAPTV